MRRTTTDLDRRLPLESWAAQDGLGLNRTPLFSPLAPVQSHSSAVRSAARGDGRIKDERGPRNRHRPGWPGQHRRHAPETAQDGFLPGKRREPCAVLQVGRSAFAGWATGSRPIDFILTQARAGIPAWPGLSSLAPVASGEAATLRTQDGICRGSEGNCARFVCRGAELNRPPQLPGFRSPRRPPTAGHPIRALLCRGSAEFCARGASLAQASG